MPVIARWIFKFLKINLARNVLIIFLYSLLSSSYSIAQPYVTSDIIIQSGSNPHFVFNTIDKFTTGITYSNHTRLNIYFTEYDEPAKINLTINSSWRLRVRSLDLSILGSSTGNPIDLNRIVILANPQTGVSLGPIFLTDQYQTIVESGPNPTTALTGGNIVEITYDVGITNKISGKSDFYVVDLDFLLEKE